MLTMWWMPAGAEAVKQVMHVPEFQAIGAACKRMKYPEASFG